MGSPNSDSSGLGRILQQFPVLATLGNSPKMLEMLPRRESGAIQMGFKEEPVPAGQVSGW